MGARARSRGAKAWGTLLSCGKAARAWLDLSSCPIVSLGDVARIDPLLQHGCEVLGLFLEDFVSVDETRGGAVSHGTT